MAGQAVVDEPVQHRDLPAVQADQVAQRLDPDR
jgi:hypothetical protein